MTNWLSLYPKAISKHLVEYRQLLNEMQENTNWLKVFLKASGRAIATCDTDVTPSHHFRLINQTLIGLAWRIHSPDAESPLSPLSLLSPRATKAFPTWIPSFAWNTSSSCWKRPHQTVPGPHESHHLPGQRALCPLSFLLLRSPSVTPVPTSTTERAAFPTSCPERALVSTYSLEGAPVPEFSPERASVPKSSPEKAPVSKSNPNPFSHPQSSICAVASPRFCQFPLALWLEDPVFASGLRVQDSGSACRSSGSTMAPSSLLSAGARQSTGSTGLPRPSSSALVWRRPSYASGLHSSGFASSLGSTLVLCCFSSTAASQIHASTSVAGTIGSTSVLQILFVTLAHRLTTSASAPPSPALLPLVGPLESSALSPPWLLCPSTSPWAVIMSVACRLPGSSLRRLHPGLVPLPGIRPPTRSYPILLSSSHLCLPLLLSTVRGRAFRGGGICQSLSILSGYEPPDPNQIGQDQTRNKAFRVPRAQQLLLPTIETERIRGRECQCWNDRE
ncbi:DNA-directed RNA polymerase II subunit RPB1 [Labeo rohita]|uniref:DNA-directed RNA polymerase II subunit RPB1 n=1 Tax=Labeo rohita TaxID=84645 RepID=A0ABQ8M604_LABRO|nr:DNA-directed RNA polymerase II subunit RPB1 [Labeo rohita]